MVCRFLAAIILHVREMRGLSTSIEMLKHLAVIGHMLVEHRLSVILIATPQDMMVCARDDADRIELHEA